MTADQFKGWRAGLGWRQAEAAARLGISRESVGPYEAGRRRDVGGAAVVIPRTVKLACAALAAGLTGWPPAGAG